MKAARVHEYGPPSVVRVEEVPAGEPGAGEVRVRVHAASVNFPDVLLVANRYQIPAPLPFTPGGEFAGVVDAVGDDVKSLRPGDHVMGASLTGAFAEQITVPAAGVTVLPDDVDFDLAAAFAVCHMTAYHSLRSVARVQPGEWVVVLGAAGGVGLAAVELARHLGGRVLAAASSPAKLEQARAVGAEAVVDYEREDLKLRVRELTEGGADVVIDPVGGQYSEPTLRAMRYGGRFVVVGFASGKIPRLPLNLVMLKGVTVKGFEMWSFMQHAGDDERRDREELFELFRTGVVRPAVSTVFDLDDVVEALELVADRRAVGKIVVRTI
jgi:NADPH2:quinone reductase